MVEHSGARRRRRARQHHRQPRVVELAVVVHDGAFEGGAVAAVGAQRGEARQRLHGVQACAVSGTWHVLRQPSATAAEGNRGVSAGAAAAPGRA